MFFDFSRTTKGLGRSFIVLSLLFMVAAVVWWICDWRFVNSASRAEGVVVKLVESRDSDSGATYRPVFAFRDSNQVTHEIQSSVGSSPPAFRVGDEVEVLYSKDDPDNAAIDRFMFLWFFPVTFGIIGAVQLILGLTFLGMGRWGRIHRA